MTLLRNSYTCRMFFGEQVKAREIGGFVLSESVYAAGERISRHSHASPSLSILIQGSYREACESQTRDCEPSTVIFHPAGEAHADRFRFEIRNFARIGAAGLTTPF